MDPTKAACPNPDCPMHGQPGEDTIALHSKKEKRWRCRKCGKTFSATTGTIFYRRKYDHRFISEIVSLMAYGCPPAAIEKTYALDERTVAQWQQAAGAHCQGLHEQILEDHPMDLKQVQADEIRVKAQGGILWMALALCVTTRLWLGGVVSPRRDKLLVRALALKVRACARCRPLLVVFDGFAAYVKAFRHAFRTALPTGKRGRPPLVAWPYVVLGQIVKSRQGRRLKQITRRVIERGRVLLPGQQTPAEDRVQVTALLAASQGGGGLNTSYIERLNATFRSRLCALVRQTRSLVRLPETLEGSMYLVGCVYNFCSVHRSLALELRVVSARGEQRRWVGRTPAMAAGLTDHRWSVRELLNYRFTAPSNHHG